MSSRAELEALRSRPLAPWFDHAKLGVFVHWGVFSVPAWAPYREDIQALIKRRGYRYQLANNPYAEWYANTIKIEGSPSQRHHAETYGDDSSYYDFVPEFVEASAGMNPEDWAELFAGAGARYVIMVTKHHDGYTLWPTEHESPRRSGLHSKRDFVREVTQAVRARGLKMGLYYSGGLDWAFNETAISDPFTFLTHTPQQDDYTSYATSQIRELIDRYRPSVLWNDIRYPRNADLVELFSHYYETVPDGVINDRWNQASYPERWPSRPVINAIGWFHAKLTPGQQDPPGIHHDYVTPEYMVYEEIRREKWEACRGLGTSFGYNRNEPDRNLLTAEELIHSFVDIVSKNGNLLINVGPMAGGTIPDVQRERLLGLGDWLAVNGEAIYGTRPWTSAEGRTSDGRKIRFTRKGDALFALILDAVGPGEITLESLECAAEARISLLGHDEPLRWRREGSRLILTLPDRLPDSPAHALKVTPPPWR